MVSASNLPVWRVPDETDVTETYPYSGLTLTFEMLKKIKEEDVEFEHFVSENLSSLADTHKNECE
jgi:hypothetical protein